jgi:NAD(P)-dependent dehydrogenase (short-subunit alcohol dehydrogenase family)
MDLTGRTIFITGASRGLGRAIAEACAAAGGRLVLCARGADELGSTADTLAVGGTEVEWGPADVTDADAVAALVAGAERRFGRVDALVNNASVLGRRVPIREQSPEEWRRVMDINVTGTLIPTLAVLPGMRRAGEGSIVNLTSGVGDRPRARWGPYAISKWAVEGFTYNLALEEEEAGIRVNAVDPGKVRTRMRRAAYPAEDPSEPAPAHEVVDVFVWLASPESSGVTGQRFRAQEWP